MASTAPVSDQSRPCKRREPRRVESSDTDTELMPKEPAYCRKECQFTAEDADFDTHSLKGLAKMIRKQRKRKLRNIDT